jgi:hypothetical protein
MRATIDDSSEKSPTCAAIGNSAQRISQRILSFSFRCFRADRAAPDDIEPGKQERPRMLPDAAGFLN